MRWYWSYLIDDIAESGIDGIQGKLVRKTNNTHLHVKLLTRVLKSEPSI